MKAFCLPKEIADKLKRAATEGQWKVEALWDMTSEQRNALFNKYVEKATAIRINAGFERAMAAKQSKSLKAWAEATFVGEEFSPTEEKKKDIYSRISELKKTGFIKINQDSKGNLKSDEAGEIFLSALAEDVLGVSLTQEEMETLAKKVEVLQQVSGKLNDLGLPIDEYWIARKDIDDYIKSLVPAHKLRVLTSTIGRGSMLTGIKTGIVNVWSNSIMRYMESATKYGAKLLRGQSTKVSAEMNQIAQDYRNNAVSIRWNYGYDVTRITSLSSDIKTLGEASMVHSQGPGTIRKIGRWYEDVIFGKMLSAPDVYFAATAFAESAKLWAIEMAKGDEGIALAIMKDAITIYPRTKEGRLIRDMAIADAQHATYTDDTKWSDFALKIRGVLNAISEDWRWGDQLMPFVKTPANVIGVGIDTAVGNLFSIASETKGLLKGAKTMAAAMEALKTAKPEQIESILRKVIVSGLTYTFAAIFVFGFDPDDFIGLYPTNSKERDLMNLQNATANSIKINGKWVSLDYFGTLSPIILSLLYARKYKGDFVNMAFGYLKGQLSAAVTLPGIEETYKGLADIKNYLSQPNSTKFQNDMVSGIVEYGRSRLVPAIIADFAKVFDKWERNPDAKNDIWGKVKSNIPGLREQLKIKTNVIGTPIKTETPLFTLIFGGRFKTAQQGKFIDEVVRLRDTGNQPTISDATFTSTRFTEMKEWLQPAEYQGLVLSYQMKWVENANRLIDTAKYQALSPEAQMEEINKVRSKAIEDAMKLYKYETLKKQRGGK